MNKTSIEYIDFTWNPIAMRCTPVSEGCDNCWHLRMADRLKNNPKIPLRIREAYAGGLPVLREWELEALLLRRKSARIGVQFMGDLFHKDVKYSMILSIFSIMESCPHHQFFLLTKRVDRMASWIEEHYHWVEYNAGEGEYLRRYGHIIPGVTVENQKRADERIPILLQIPAAKRFVSIEPMLERIDLSRIHIEDVIDYDVLNGIILEPGSETSGDNIPKIDWVIVGGESGPGARPIHSDWARSVRDQCQAASVPFFFKQMSKKAPIPDDLKIKEFPE